MMIISQCFYFLHPVYFLSYPIFASLFQGPTSPLCSLAALVFHSASTSFFPHPTVEVSSVFHISFFYTFYAMSMVSDCQGSVQTNQKLIPVSAYMTFLIVCLYKKTGLRKNDTRESRRAMIPSDPDTNSLLHVQIPCEYLTTHCLTSHLGSE